MRFLILSDLHANWEALVAVLRDAKAHDYQAILCLGDVVGYGPNPNEVTTWVRTHADVVVRGNHDKACSGLTSCKTFGTAAQYSSYWTLDTLTDDNKEWLRNLPRGPVQVENLDLVHGAPDDEDRYMFHEHDAATGIYHAREQVTFFGHTHVQGCFVAESCQRGFETRRLDTLPAMLAVNWDRRYLLNPGAVGQPRDGDPRAAYCIFDSCSYVAEFHRVEYDIRTVQDKILAAKLPKELAFRLASGK